MGHLQGGRVQVAAPLESLAPSGESLLLDGFFDLADGVTLGRGQRPAGPAADENSSVRRGGQRRALPLAGTDRSLERSNCS
jgi:hypothetical protein